MNLLTNLEAMQLAPRCTPEEQLALAKDRQRCKRTRERAPPSRKSAAAADDWSPETDPSSPPRQRGKRIQCAAPISAASESCHAADFVTLRVRYIGVKFGVPIALTSTPNDLKAILIRQLHFDGHPSQIRLIAQGSMIDAMESTRSFGELGSFALESRILMWIEGLSEQAQAAMQHTAAELTATQAVSSSTALSTTQQYEDGTVAACIAVVPPDPILVGIETNPGDSKGGDIKLTTSERSENRQLTPDESDASSSETCYVPSNAVPVFTASLRTLHLCADPEKPFPLHQAQILVQAIGDGAVNLEQLTLRWTRPPKGWVVHEESPNHTLARLDILPLTQLQHLHTFRFEWCGYNYAMGKMSDAILNAIRLMPALTDLDICDGQFRDDPLRADRTLCRLTAEPHQLRLRNLNVSRTLLISRHTEALARLPTLTQLSLDIGRRLTSFDFLAQLPLLHKLALRTVNDEQLFNVLRFTPHLTSLTCRQLPPDQLARVVAMLPLLTLFDVTTGTSVPIHRAAETDLARLVSSLGVDDVEPPVKRCRTASSAVSADLPALVHLYAIAESNDETPSPPRAFKRLRSTPMSTPDRLIDHSSQLNDDDAADDDEMFEVECILDKREEEGQTFFLVRWKNYPSEEATWEPSDSVIETAADAVAEFELEFSKVQRSVSCNAQLVISLCWALACICA